MGAYQHLFSPFRLGSVTLKNRVVMSPMGTLFCEPDGSVSDQMVAYYQKRAAGGVGMILLEYTSVDFPRGRGSVNQLSLSDDSVIPGFKKLAECIRPYGAKVLAQLHHAGERSVSLPGELNVGPMDHPGKCRALTKEDLSALAARYAEAAKRAKTAGLDGVEIHAGHGYLVNQFLSPLTNQRADEYGGSTENRARFLIEILRAVRAACPRPFLLSVRLAVRDWAEGGITVEEGVKLAGLIDQEDIDLINCTSGLKSGYFGAVETQDRPDGNRLDLARAVRPQVKHAVAIVGKLRTGAMCDAVIADGTADLVLLGRPLICDPEWPNKMRTGREEEIRTCINCMEGCYAALGQKGGVRCALNPTVGYEDRYDENELPLARTPKAVAVVGGGVTGLQAAVTAAERGHKVVLLEQSGQLGGQLNLACLPPHKQDLNTIVPYYERRLRSLGAEVVLNADALKEIEARKIDKVILATGSTPFVPPIPGIERAVGAWDVLSGKAAVAPGQKAVIIGGGNVGCETALFLLERGAKAAIIEMLPTLSNGQEATHRTRDLGILKASGSPLYTQAKVQEVTGEGVVFTDAGGVTRTEVCDVVITCTGQRPAGGELFDALCARGYDVVKAGDALGMGNIRSNVRSGFLIGYGV